MRLHKAVAGLAISGLAATSLTLLATHAEAASNLAPLLGPTVQTARTGASVIPGSYIVVLKDSQGLRSAGVRTGSSLDVAKAAASRATKAGGRIGKTYSSVFPGYSATLSASELTAVRQDPAVKYVQRNLKRSIDGAWEKNVDSWGLDRIDQRSLPVNTSYYHSARGAGVTAYVLDTGVYAGHPDFGGRAATGDDEVGTTNGTTDCNGHGTHVAGTIGGQIYGVAKAVQIVPVRALDCQGDGNDADIIAGMDWIEANRPATPALVNMSLGGGFSQAFNDAVQSMIDLNLTVVVAAGNETANACTESPSSLPDAITVAASTKTDKAASFSNYGRCVDLYAPGEKIISDVPGKQDGQFWIATLSGTSMAAPHVTGTAALYLEKHPDASPAEVSAGILGMSSANKIGGAPSGTPKNLLFSLETVPVPSGVTGGDRLLSGQNLLRGTRLYSPNNGYFLAHRSKDGWLCLYDNETGKVIWSSGHSAAWTNMNTTGALSSYDAYGRRVWTTGTTSGVSDLFVNGKGYLMIKTRAGKVTWTTPH